MKQKDMEIQMLGKTGEAIIRNLLVDAGFTVKDSFDQFDSEKDFLATKDDTAYTVEVKTEQPYVLKDMISFGERQLKKCMNVDYLFFVLAPPVMRPDYKHAGKILFARPLKEAPVFERYTTKDGKKKVGFRIEQAALKHVADLSREEIAALSRHTVSNYRRGYGNGMRSTTM